jgi:hypothetical protein
VSKNPKIGEGGIEALALNVLKNPSYRLKELILEDCDIGDAALHHISNVIATNTKLTFLNISKCQITWEGAEAFSWSIADNEYMLILIMHWNQIGWYGGMCMAQAMTTNKSINILDLSFCGMGRQIDPESIYDPYMIDIPMPKEPEHGILTEEMEAL